MLRISGTTAGIFTDITVLFFAGMTVPLFAGMTVPHFNGMTVPIFLLHDGVTSDRRDQSVVEISQLAC